jgi:hypothetical protein
MISLPKALLLYVALASATGAYAQGWKGIVPLHSTRADVERLLGPGAGACKCSYETEGESLRVEYAKGPCQGYPSGWNVPADTVLAVRVSPHQKRPFSEFRLDESKYEKASDDTFTTYFASRDEGIQYVVSYESVDSAVGQVISRVNYVPSSKDSRLRCPCFPAEDESIFRTLPYEEFSVRVFEDSLGRLDNFAIQLMQVPRWKGYVIVYAKKQHPPARAKRYARSFREYLVGRRRVPAERITAMYGGYRNDLTVELYLFSTDAPPPRPRPSYVPCTGAKNLE